MNFFSLLLPNTTLNHYMLIIVLLIVVNILLTVNMKIKVFVHVHFFDRTTITRLVGRVAENDL